jgi:hypothetical protein
MLLVFLPACGGEKLTGPTQVYKLQVLSIKADKPEVHPGDEVTVSALIGIPMDYDKEYTRAWVACDPKSSVGQAGLLECMKNSKENFIQFSVDDTIKFKVPDDTLVSYGLKKKDLYITLVLCKASADLCFNLMSDPDNKEGFDGLDRDIFSFAYKRVSVISKEQEITNFNPEIEKIYLNDIELTSNNLTLKGRDTISEDNSKNNIFKVSVTNDSFNKFKNAKGELINENVTIAFRSTAGEFQKYLTDPKENDDLSMLDEVKYKSAVGDNTEYKIYIVAMDQRGGADWKVLTVTNE